MNIFYLDRNITKCAQAHCDKHVNKMILEGAQLLASAHHLTNPEASTIPNMYRLTHKNHPDAIWVRSSINHYLYLMDLMEALNAEAQYRYKHSKTHVSLAKVSDGHTRFCQMFGLPNLQSAYMTTGNKSQILLKHIVATISETKPT